jgi:hypothetical protein
MAQPLALCHRLPMRRSDLEVTLLNQVRDLPRNINPIDGVIPSHVSLAVTDFRWYPFSVPLRYGTQSPVGSVPASF